jgi:hypothetical protein
MSLRLSQEFSENSVAAQKYGDGEVEDVVRHARSSASETER